MSNNAFMTLGNYASTMVLSHHSGGVINTIKASLEGGRVLPLSRLTSSLWSLSRRSQTDRCMVGTRHFWKRLPISTRIEYKVLLIVLKVQMGVAPKYLRDAIRLPTCATSLRPLRSMERRELFVPRARTTMAMSRSFAVIAPSLWNRLAPYVLITS